MRGRSENFDGISSAQLNVFLFASESSKDKRIEIFDKIFSTLPKIYFKRRDADRNLNDFENIIERPTILIMEHYNEYEFQIFSNFGCYVYGFGCMLNCLSKELSLPVSRYMTVKDGIKLPIFFSSETDKALVVTVCGFDAYFKDKLVKYITLLGWKYSSSIDTKSTTHVICGNCFTEEASMASRGHIPLVTEHWVTSSVAEGILNRRPTKRTTNSHFVSHLNYICKLFHNVKICCINFCTYKHNDIKNKILSNGGLFYIDRTLADCSFNVNIDIFLYLNPCQCEFCTNATDSEDCSSRQFSWSKFVEHYQLPNRHAAIVKSSWLFSSIRSNIIAPVKLHLYGDNSDLSGDGSIHGNYFHLNKYAINYVSTSEPYNDNNTNIVVSYSDFFNQDNSIDFCFNSDICCYQIHCYSSFLQYLSTTSVTKGLATVCISDRWLSECYNYQKIVPLHWFTFQLPCSYWDGSFRLYTNRTLLTGSKVYIADNFIVGYLFESVDQLKDLLVWMGGTIVLNEHHADIIFDNSNESSKSVFWLESIIYHQQLMLTPQNFPLSNNEHYPQMLFSGFINPSLVGSLFQHQTFEIANTIPSSVIRQMAVIISEYGGTLILDPWNSTTTQKQRTTSFGYNSSNYFYIQSLKSFYYVFESISTGKPISSINFERTNKKLYSLIMGEILMRFSSCHTPLQQLNNAHVYFSSDLISELDKLIPICQSLGAIVTDNVTVASHIIVNNVESFSEKFLFGDKLSNHKLICSELLLKDQSLAIGATTLCQSQQCNALTTNTRIENSSILDNELEKSIQKSIAKNNKIIELENDIKTIMEKSSNISNRLSLSIINDEKKPNLIDSNLNSILMEMEQSFNLESQLKDCLDLSSTNLADDDDNEVLITYDHGGEDLIECPPIPNITSLPTHNLKTRGKNVYNFLISSLSTEFKSKLSDIIQSLGGVYLNTSSFSAKSTHLIIGNEIIKNEKLLCCLATGRPILHYSYIEESKEAGYFVDDVQFMYENNCNHIDPIYADAFAHWHSKFRLNQSGGGAFYDWHVVLYLESSNKQEGFERLITEAGGGIVYPVEQCVSWSKQKKITHIFIENANQSNITSTVARFLAAHSDKVFKVNYLADYLLCYNDFCADDYLVDLNYSKFDSSDSSNRSTNANILRRSSRKRKSINRR